MSEIKTTEGLTLEEIVNAVTAMLKPELAKEVTEVELLETHFPKGSVKRYRNIEKYPPIMYIEDVKDFTRLGNNKVYEFLNHPKCPTIRYGKMSVYRDDFIKFYLELRGVWYVDTNTNVSSKDN